ncbi:MAG TPA: hypothetical protein PK142_02410 [bacterium]|nr:hypothetical protein [bacterium]
MKADSMELTFSTEEDIRIQRIEVISQKEANQIWGIYNPREDYDKPRFPKEALKEVAEISDEDFDNVSDYLIIFLTGLSIKEMRKIANKNVRFITQELAKKEYDKKGVGGYYLIKMKRTYLEGLTPGRQDGFGIIPPKWRRANIREAAEILLILFFLTGEKHYLNQWHICYGEEDKDGRNFYNLVRFAVNSEKMTFFTRKKVSGCYDLNSITIRKAL